MDHFGIIAPATARIVESVLATETPEPTKDAAPTQSGNKAKRNHQMPLILLLMLLLLLRTISPRRRRRVDLKSDKESISPDMKKHIHEEVRKNFPSALILRECLLRRIQRNQCEFVYHASSSPVLQPKQ